MADEQKVRQLIEHAYASLGNVPAQPLVSITPKDGRTWETALSYKVVRADGKRARVWRKSIDDNNNQAIRDALRQFRES